MFHRCGRELTVQSVGVPLRQTLAAGAISLHTLAEEKTHAVVRQHTLHHREALHEKSVKETLRHED